MKSVVRLITMIVLVAIFVLPASAQRLEKLVSGKGQVNPTSAGGCVPGSTNVPCVIFSQTSATTATWTNLEFDGSVDGPYDVFLVPTTQTATFQVTGSPVFGSFLCGDDPTMTTQLNGFCNNVDPDDSTDTSGFFTLNPSAPNSSGQLTFGFNAAAVGLPAEWAFYFTAGDAKLLTGGGGSTGVPEPATLALLACGLLALGCSKRLRTQG